MGNFLRNHILKIIIIPLVILFVGASYVRFVLLNDYMVSYEVACNPETDSCFIGCSDDECTQQYPYYTVEKYATNVTRECGSTIENCTFATQCVPEDTDTCTMTYCSPETGDTCFIATDTTSSQVELDFKPI